MVRGVSFLAAALAAACQFPAPADKLPDAGPDAPTDAPTDAPADRVVGRVYFEHVTPSGTVEVPQDLTIYTIHALVPSESGLQTVVGVGRADGTFQIDGVPPGVEYWVKVGRDPYLTRSHELTFRHPTSTRANAPLATQSTSVSFAGALPTFAAGDQLHVRSHLAQVEHRVDLTPGATAFAHQVDWLSLAPQRSALPDGTIGDDLGIYLLRTTPAATPDVAEVQRVVAGITFDSIRIVDGTPTSAQGDLTPPSGSLELLAGYSRDAFEVGEPSSTGPTSMTVECGAFPATAQPLGGSRIFLPILRVSQYDWRATDERWMRIDEAFPDPYPAPWPRLCRFGYSRKRAYRDGGGTVRPAFARGSRLAEPSAISRSLLPPPRDVRVDGRNVDWGGLLAADQPHSLTWVGSTSANMYRVTIFSHPPGANRRFHLVLTSDRPSFVLYPEFLAGTEYVSFEVTTISAQNDYAAGDLAPWGVPSMAAGVLSAVFRVSSTCGDGQVDVGEDCDGRGETATCDVDCTAVTCGDGLRNPTAGELCDPVEDAVGCDADCTPAVCGDGYRNTATEACDDGGTAAGDGCSPTCRVE